MKIANIVLRLDRVGNTIRRNYVTPAEVMVLVAEHRHNCGADPIQSLEEVKPDSIRQLLKAAQAESAAHFDNIQKLEALENMLPDVREQRVKALQSKIASADERAEEAQRILSLFSLDAAGEKRRLVTKFGGLKIKDLLAGSTPTLPETFEEARQIGLASSTHSERLVTTGDVNSLR